MLAAKGSPPPPAPGDFPIVCAKCLGPNPYLRMMKVPHGASCRISGTPFTVHRWKAPGSGRQRETIIAPEVATAKNICQCCLDDLEYNVPSHVVDAVLAAVDDAPRAAESDANREFYWDEKRRAVADGREDGGGTYGKLRANIDKLERLASRKPYDNPYKHGPGQVPAPRPKREPRDPAKEHLPPRDKSITTLFVAGVSPGISERELTRHFAAYGPISSIKMNPEKLCAHVTYHARESAFNACNALRDNLTIDGTRLRVLWGRSTGSGRDRASDPNADYGPPSLPPGIRQLPPGVRAPAQSTGMAGGGAQAALTYPSMHREALDAAGTRPEAN